MYSCYRIYIIIIKIKNELWGEMADIDYTAKWTMKALLAYYFSLPAGHPHGFQVTRNSAQAISELQCA